VRHELINVMSAGRLDTRRRREVEPQSGETKELLAFPAGLANAFASIVTPHSGVLVVNDVTRASFGLRLLLNLPLH
jgi:hypothetical protein